MSSVNQRMYHNKYSYFSSKNLLLLLFILLLITSLAHARPSLQDYAKLDAISIVRMSPGGERVSFIKREDGSSLLFVYSLKDKKVIDATNLGDLTVVNLYFLNNDQVVYIAAERSRLIGFIEEALYSTAFILDIKTKKIRQLLTLGNEIYRAQTGLGKIVGLSKDGNYAYMPAFAGDDVFQDDNPEYSLMKVDLRRKRPPRRELGGSIYTYRYFMSKNGEPLAELRYNDRKNIHQILAYKKRKKHIIFEKEEAIKSFKALGVTPDQKSLVISTDTGDDGRYALRTIALKDGAISAPIFNRDDADIKTVHKDIYEVFYGVTYAGVNPSYEFYDKRLNEKVKGIVDQVEGVSVFLEDFSENKDRLIVRLEGTHHAGEYYLVDKDNKTHFLTSKRPQIQPKDVHPLAQISFNASDGLKIPILLTIPLNKTANLKNLPAVLLPHAGLRSSDIARFDWFAQALANEGYLVVQPQFRGTFGFGVSHLEAGFGQWGKKMQDDLTESVNFLTSKGIVDSERVCIAGIGYGGYAALAGAAFTPELYKCSISMNGIYDLYEMLLDEKWSFGRHSWVLDYWKREWTGDENSKRKYTKEYLKSISPIEHIDSIRIPVLLVNGMDPCDNKRQTKSMYKTLRKAEKQVNYLTLKGEGECFSTYEDRLKILQSTTEFLANNLINKKDH